ncbi:MAG: amino acid adenylation domain-containing protein, partial [Clostridia bacterium]|nr:amino acid adenylation domain-containing protein [Clostridia bacterium]
RVGNRKQVIGVLCDRSFEELAAIWGVVRGGNTYLPLSPDFPPERIRLLLEQADCALVLAQEKYRYLTDKAVSIADVITADLTCPIPAPAAGPDDPLYVIFTSGSTGVPKGAVVKNRSIVNRVGWMADRYFDEDTVVMLKTPYTFDVSVWEIFGFAMHGFSLHILPPGGHYSMAATLDAIAKGRVTDLHFVPTVFTGFTEYLTAHPEEREKLCTLKNVFLSGEALRAAQVNAFYALVPEGVKIRNLYGPAECAVDVTFYDCEPGITDPVPIGRPIDNTRIYVLDEYLQPAPVGVTGQICIAGANVGLGYLGKPELTKERFIDDPFGEGKMYLTGDLGYWREDGQLVFVGRNDSQVKLNGQRIEPGEIEAALSAAEGVELAAVKVQKDGDRQVLCAYYTGEEKSQADLRAILAVTLPRYMVPNVFIRLEEMPLTSSGKLDRNALPEADLTHIGREDEYSPPQNETEKKICEAFSEILGVDKVSRNENFYDLGGSSIQLIRLLAREPLDALSVAEFVKDPTPAGLAKRLDAGKKPDYTVLIPLYVPENARRAVVLFPYAGGDASAFTRLTAAARKSECDLALYTLDWPDANNLQDAEKEIRNLAAEIPVYFYSHCAGSVIAMMLLDRLNAQTLLIRGYLAAGSIPPRKSPIRFNAWPGMSDDAILKALEKAGLFADGINAGIMKERLARFREQTEVFSKYFHGKTKKTNVTVTVLLSKNDPFTPNCADADRRWRKAVTDVDRMVLIDTPSHYFQSTDAGLLLSLLSELPE